MQASRCMSDACYAGSQDQVPANHGTPMHEGPQGLWGHVDVDLPSHPGRKFLAD